MKTLKRITLTSVSFGPIEESDIITKLLDRFNSNNAKFTKVGKPEIIIEQLKNTTKIKLVQVIEVDEVSNIDELSIEEKNHLYDIYVKYILLYRAVIKDERFEYIITDEGEYIENKEEALKYLIKKTMEK